MFRFIIKFVPPKLEGEDWLYCCFGRILISVYGFGGSIEFRKYFENLLTRMGKKKSSTSMGIKSYIIRVIKIVLVLMILGEFLVIVIMQFLA